METTYIDERGIVHDLQIFKDLEDEETIYIVHRDGSYYMDLVQRDGEWIEVYEGPTERATRFGKIVERLCSKTST